MFENCFNNQGGSLFGSGNLNQNDERNNSSKLFANNINNIKINNQDKNQISKQNINSNINEDKLNVQIVT